MKKKEREKQEKMKLRLSRETLRDLQGSDLEKVEGNVGSAETQCLCTYEH